MYYNSILDGYKRSTQTLYCSASLRQQLTFWEHVDVDSYSARFSILSVLLLLAIHMNRGNLCWDRVQIVDYRNIIHRYVFQVEMKVIMMFTFFSVVI